MEAAIARQGQNSIVITSSQLYGRTGNFVTMATHAIAAARVCRFMLALPVVDGDKAFTLDARYAVYDFRNKTEGNQVTVNMKHMTVPVDTSHHCRAIMDARNVSQAKLLYETHFDAPDRDVDHCVRRYLGLCQPEYCGNLQQELANTLVMHIRQGDIFPEHFDNHVQHRYWQPPLDYYLAAMVFKGWSGNMVLSEPTTTNLNPVLLMLESLDRRGLLPSPIQFMQDVPGRRWADDVRTMICAPNIVLSKSTLKAVVQLGWAQQVFALDCDGDYVNTPTTYQISMVGENGEDYVPSHRHTNSPEEWVQMLLHRLPVDVVKPCKEAE
jgi:hypothetical protein